MLEAAILLKEAGLLDASGDEPSCPVGIVPLFETIDDLQRGASILEAALDLPLYRALVARPRRQPGGDARLLGLQQGRRLSGGELGAVPRRARPRRVGPQDRNPVAALPRSRRHRRPRRRTQLRRHPRAAAGRGVRLAADHRAGRGDRRQVRRAADRAPQPRDAVGRHAGVHAARRGGTRRRRRARVPGARRTGRLRPAGVRRIGPRDTGFRRVLQGVDAGQRDRRAQHRQPARVAQADHVDLRSSGHPVGAGLEPVAGDAAGLVRHGIGVRAVDRRRRRQARGAAGPLPAVAVLPHRAVEHGAGDGQVRHGPGGALLPSWSPTRRCATGCSTRSSPSTTARSGCTA